MVLINNLTIDEINAALLHLQRARTEVVGGTKGSTVQNITISNKGGGSTVDYAPTITALSNRIDKNTDDIESVEGEIDKIQATLEQLSNNGISSMTFDPISRQLQINTQDGEVYSCDITSENIILNFDATTNKLTLEMGEQYQEVTLPYINANEKGSANGVATLDSSGRVPYSQLPESAMEFLGQWNASTNTPHLEDGTGTNGDFYVCNVGGTVTFGTGNTQTFVPNDRVIYNGATSQWIKLPAGQVSSVNGMSGDVTLTASNIEYSTGVSIKAKIDTLGTAAYCNADCFRPSSWTPSCVSCAGVSYTTCVNYTGSYNDNFDLALLATNPRNCIYQASCSNYRVTFNPNSGQLTAPYIQLGTGCATQGAGTIYGRGTCANYALICLLNNTSDIWGNGVSIGGGGIVIVGSGESASTVWTSLNGSGNLYGGAAGYECTFITSDGAVYLFSNVQNGYACRKVAYLDTSGVFHADSFCGTVSFASCAEATCFANCVCKTKYCTSCNCDLNIMMVSSVPGSSNDFAQGYAQGCCLTYNPSTGQLRLKSNGKTACLSHINSSFFHIYTDAPAIAFNQYLLMAGANNYVCGNLCGVASQAVRLNASHVNEFNFCVGANSPRVWFNYRNGSTDAADSTHLITDYFFGNRNQTTSGVTLHADCFCGVASCALRANCADVGTLSWTSCGCGVYVSGCFVRAEFYQDEDRCIYWTLRCFAQVANKRKDVANSRRTSVVGSFCCISGSSEGEYFGITFVVVCSGCAYLYRSLGDSDYVCFSCSSTGVKSTTNFKLLTVR